MNQKTAVKQLKILAKNLVEMRLAAESWNSPFQILISTIMSARTRDEVTIPTAEKLFRKYPDSKKLSKTKTSEIQKIIRPVNFYKNKSKNIIACAKRLETDFKGKVPKTMKGMLTIPGVGRKTANVVLGELYGTAEGIAVDTHVIRLSRLLGLTKHKDATKIEQDLMEIIPKKDWVRFSHLLILYGREYCSARCKHTSCPLAKFYPSQ